MTALLSEEFFVMFLIKPLNDKMLKMMYLSTSQCISSSLFYFLLQDSQKPKVFYRNIQTSRFNICFRGVLTSVHEQQLHYLEASMILFL